jgi:hypothetical protein
MTDGAIQGLVSLGWSREQVRLGDRARWCCEYCGQNLLDNPDAYASWQIDHIVPVRAGGSGDFANLALACRNCNFLFKNKWDPRSDVDPSVAADRDALICAVKAYVATRRSEYDTHLLKVRSVIANDANRESI